MKTGSFTWWVREMLLLAFNLAVVWIVFTLAVTFLLFLLGL
jgi:hypothetical protein